MTGLHRMKHLIVKGYQYKGWLLLLVSVKKKVTRDMYKTELEWQVKRGMTILARFNNEDAAKQFVDVLATSELRGMEKAMQPAVS